VDFAYAKSIAARRKQGYFPLENPKKCVFRRAISDRPYILKRKYGFSPVWEPPARAVLFIHRQNSGAGNAVPRVYFFAKF
jgi:hypothetical protein